MILDTGGRFVILDSSGGLAILDPSGQFFLGPIFYLGPLWMIFDFGR